MKYFRPLWILVATVALLSAFQFASVASGRRGIENVTPLTSFGLSLAFIVWVMADAQIRRRIPCYEFGFLVAVFFPVSLVWYVLWSRGWRAIFMLAGLFGLMLLPSLSMIAAWIIRIGGA
jgi:hypothetical protein